MTPRWVWISLAVGLAAVVSLVFAFPHQMVSPGNLKPAHSKLQQDCFACHMPLGGASPRRCISCHAISDIGRRTTAGKPIAHSTRAPLFHQKLATQDCMACHTDHPRPLLTRRTVRSFDHALLRSDARSDCASCHRPPANDFHRNADRNCGQCHGSRSWTPANFNHDRYFSLAPPHNATCSTCHVGGNVKTFTCFNCHEHKQSQIEARHREEGISDIENCVRCHRSASDEHGEGGRGTGGERESERDD